MGAFFIACGKFCCSIFAVHFDCGCVGDKVKLQYTENILMNR